MIVLFRVDDRLIHGQVQTTLITTVGAQTILILDEGTYHNEVAKQMLKLACPANVKLRVAGDDDALRLLAEAEASPRNILVLFKTIKTAGNLCAQGYHFDAVNIGPVSMKPGARDFGKNAYLDEAEVAAAETLVADGTQVYFQLTPDTKRRNWGD